MLVKNWIVLVVITIWAVTSNAQFSIYKYPKDQCSTFLVTEFTASRPFTLMEPALDREFDVNGNLGLMHHLSEKIAIGAHYFAGAFLNGGWHTQMGIRPRISYYFEDDYHLDFSPGMILNDSRFHPDGFTGYSLENNFNWRDHFGISTRLDYFDEHAPERKNEVVLNLGIQTDGVKGISLITAGVLGGLIGIVLSSN